MNLAQFWNTSNGALLIMLFLKEASSNVHGPCHLANLFLDQILSVYLTSTTLIISVVLHILICQRRDDHYNIIW